MPPANPTPSPATPVEVKQTFGDRLKQFLDDVATLDVLTLSGQITLDAGVASTAGNDEVVNWDKMFEKVTAGMKASGANQLKVVAYTHAQWDCDSVNFVKEGASDSEQSLIESHRKTVEAAHRSRYEALKFIGDAIKTLT